jgi:uncharacterized C2H2 Zn-finger protein
MNKLNVVVAVGLLLTGVPFTGTVRAEGVEENMTVVPGRTITSGEESTISSAALKTLRHIAQARAYIHVKDLLKAQKELKQAKTLLEIIKTTVPTDKIKDRIWVAKKHLSYEDTETVMQDLIPIYSSLDEIEEFAPMDRAKEHINKAKNHLKNGNKKGADEELKLADEAVVFTEVDLPLKDTERHVNAANMYLTKKEPKKADAALKSAEDGVQFLSMMDSSPVLQAKKSFWHATQNYAAGRTEAAKADIKEAKAYLVKAGKIVDAKTKTEAEKLVKDIEAIEVKMDKVDHETGQELKKLYERFKALTLNTVNMFQAGGNKSKLSDEADWRREL